MGRGPRYQWSPLNLGESGITADMMSISMYLFIYLVPMRLMYVVSENFALFTAFLIDGKSASCANNRHNFEAQELTRLYMYQQPERLAR